MDINQVTGFINGYNNAVTSILYNDGILRQRPGGRLNKKDGLSRYGDSHVKDKTS